jgi:hypothetical protein
VDKNCKKHKKPFKWKKCKKTQVEKIAKSPKTLSRFTGSAI